ncbi:MAG: hypothetical protein IPN34_24510 [Planctomycetes bacterium]|nr:hypothetical protein [Planctomycetota bacterium]
MRVLTLSALLALAALTGDTFAQEPEARSLTITPRAVYSPSGGVVNLRVSLNTYEYALVYYSQGGVPIYFVASGRWPSFWYQYTVQPGTPTDTLEFSAFFYDSRTGQPTGALATQFTVYGIETETECALPTPRDRRQLGIDERVRIRTIPAISLHWSVDNRGFLTALFNPSTTLYAAAFATPHKLIGELDGHICEIGFNSIEPTTVNYTWKRDEPPGLPGTSRMGVRGVFDVIAQPTNVSFEEATLRVRLDPQTTLWHNGNVSTRPLEYWTLPVSCENKVELWAWWGTDTTAILEPIYKLRPQGSSTYLALWSQRLTTLEFRNEDSNWVARGSRNFGTLFEGDGVGQVRGRAQLRFTGAGGSSTGAMGPFR